MENWDEYLQAVLNYYDDKLSRLDKKFKGSPFTKGQDEVYTFYQNRRHEIFEIINQNFFSVNGGIPEEYKRNDDALEEVEDE